jgi:hypothetical protein
MTAGDVVRHTGTKKTMLLHDSTTHRNDARKLHEGGAVFDPSHGKDGPAVQGFRSASTSPRWKGCHATEQGRQREDEYHFATVQSQCSQTREATECIGNAALRDGSKEEGRFAIAVQLVGPSSLMGESSHRGLTLLIPDSYPLAIRFVNLGHPNSLASRASYYIIH